MFTSPGAITFDESGDVDECDGGSHIKDSQSSDTEEHYVELDQKRAHLLNKIERVKEKLIAANRVQQNDVDEFLTVNADTPNATENPQLMRIRQVFEKKNKKSAQLIQVLQKKLETCQQLLRNLESSGPTPPTRRSKHDNVLISVGQSLKDAGQNIKQSITGYTGTVISVPKDLAHKLLKRSGSADNIPAVNSKNEVEFLSHHVKSKTALLPRNATAGGRSVFYTSLTDRNRTGSDSYPSLLGREFGGPSPAPHQIHNLHHPLATPQRPSVASSAANNYNYNSYSNSITGSTAPGVALGLGFGASPPGQASTPGFLISEEQQTQLNNQMRKIFSELEKFRDEMHKIHVSIEELRVHAQQEYAYLHGALHEEKYRAQRLEDQINDQSELQQAEMTNLRQEVQNLDGRLTYQVNSRMEDVHDEHGKLCSEVTALKNRIKEVQQFVGMEGCEGTSVNAKCRRGVMLLAQFLADFLLWVVSLLNGRHVKAFLMALFVALILYHVGGFLVWNAVVYIFRQIIFGKQAAQQQQTNAPNLSNDAPSASNQ